MRFCARCNADISLHSMQAIYCSRKCKQAANRKRKRARRRLMRDPRFCLVCNTDISLRDAKARYCSDRCRNLARDQSYFCNQSINKQCVFCGGEFQITNRLGRGRLTCSQACWKQYDHQRDSLYKETHREQIRAYARQHYWEDPECGREARRRSKLKHREEILQKRDRTSAAYNFCKDIGLFENVQKRCIVCGTEFRASNNRKVCSVACRKTRTRELNRIIAWRNGRLSFRKDPLRYRLFRVDKTLLDLKRAIAPFLSTTNERDPQSSYNRRQAAYQFCKDIGLFQQSVKTEVDHGADAKQ
jgi:predicted nucleic acid-binding Zn ribbon protein